MPLYLRLVADDIRLAVRKRIRDLRLLHIHRNIDKYRTRTAAGGDIKASLKTAGMSSACLTI